MSEHQIIEMVRQYLNHHPLPGNRIEVLGEQIYCDKGMWFVPVRLEQELPKTYQYYEELVEVEDDIREHEEVNVLLVPAG